MSRQRFHLSPYWPESVYCGSEEDGGDEDVTGHVCEGDLMDSLVNIDETNDDETDNNITV